jgi:hypothetical protein
LSLNKEISNKTKDGGFSRNKQQKLIFETIKRIKTTPRISEEIAKGLADYTKTL